MLKLTSKILAYRPALQAFRLALRGYSVASLPRALRFARSHLACFAHDGLTRARFASLENFRKKKCVSIDSKCSETQRNAKNKFYPFDPLRASRVAQSPSGEA